MEFVLLVGCGVLLLMVLKRANATRDQAARTERALDDITERLDRLSRQLVALARSNNLGSSPPPPPGGTGRAAPIKT